MRWTVAILVIIMLLLTVVPGASATRDSYLHVDKVTMQLEGYNATLVLYFHLDALANAYVLLFGSKGMEPEVSQFFSNFSDVRMLSLQKDSAQVKVVNITRSVDEREDRIYFLYPPYRFDQRVPVIVIMYPDGSRLELYNRDSTPAKIATTYK